MSIIQQLPDRFDHALFAVWIVVFAIDVFLPRTRRSLISPLAPWSENDDD
jgi:hypothetical protein